MADDGNNVLPQEVRERGINPIEQHEVIQKQEYRERQLAEYTEIVTARIVYLQHLMQHDQIVQHPEIHQHILTEIGKRKADIIEMRMIISVITGAELALHQRRQENSVEIIQNMENRAIRLLLNSLHHLVEDPPVLIDDDAESGYFTEQLILLQHEFDRAIAETMEILSHSLPVEGQHLRAEHAEQNDQHELLVSIQEQERRERELNEADLILRQVNVRKENAEGNVDISHELLVQSAGKLFKARMIYLTIIEGKMAVLHRRRQNESSEHENSIRDMQQRFNRILIGLNWTCGSRLINKIFPDTEIGQMEQQLFELDVVIEVIVQQARIINRIAGRIQQLNESPSAG